MMKMIFNSKINQVIMKIKIKMMKMKITKVNSPAIMLSVAVQGNINPNGVMIKTHFCLQFGVKKKK